MESIFTIGKRVRIAEPSWAETDKGRKKTHFGRIENIVKSMFDNTDLYLVRVLGEVKAYRKESLIPLGRGRINSEKIVNNTNK